MQKKLGQGSSLIGRASVSGTASFLSNGAQTNGLFSPSIIILSCFYYKLERLVFFVLGQNVIRQTAAGGGPSVVMGGGVSLEISGYPRPDTDQMIPFKPKLNTNTSYHPVPGGMRSIFFSIQFQFRISSNFLFNCLVSDKIYKLIS